MALIVAPAPPTASCRATAASTIRCRVSSRRSARSRCSYLRVISRTPLCDDIDKRRRGCYAPPNFIIHHRPRMAGGASEGRRARPAEEHAMDAALRPYALARGEGQAVWFLGAQTWIKATAEQTGG